MTAGIGNNLRKPHGVWERNPHCQAGTEVNRARNPAVQGSGPIVNTFTGAELGQCTNGRESISRYSAKHLKHMGEVVLEPLMC